MQSFFICCRLAGGRIASLRAVFAQCQEPQKKAWQIAPQGTKSPIPESHGLTNLPTQSNQRGVGLEPTACEGMGLGQGIRPHQSPLALRGSYSLSLVRLTL
jgi:hypothetical protein